MDHNPLTSLKGLKDTGGCLTLWIMFLQQFNFDVKYKYGSTHTNVDALSRQPPSPPIAAITKESPVLTNVDNI